VGKQLNAQEECPGKLRSANLALCDSVSCEVVTLTWGLVRVCVGMDRRFPRTREVGRIISAQCRLVPEFKWLGLDPPRGLVSGSSPLVRRRPNASLRPFVLVLIAAPPPSVVPGRRAASPSPATRVRREGGAAARGSRGQQRPSRV
jgi:hypothetical protein